jgi:hypothetical protein
MLVPNAHAASRQASHARSHVAAAAPPVSVTYHFQAQLVQGMSAGSTVVGQITGMMASTGALSAATLTTTTGITATVTGTFTGTDKMAPTAIVVKGKAGNMTLNGHSIGMGAIQWGGTIAQGSSTNAGSWLMTPETQSLSIDIGGKSATGSTHKVSLAGALSLMMTANGWADGSFTLLTNGTVDRAYGQMLDGNLTVTIHMPGQGDVLLVGSSKPFLQLNKWSGSFAGPTAGDNGTWIGED